MSTTELVERRRFTAMGSTVEIVVIGVADRRTVDAAVARIEELERRWSRFIDTSEVAELNRNAGAPVAVSDDTRLLVELACDAWRRTGGRFDPTVLRAVEAIGYTGSFGPRMPDPGELPCPTLASPRRATSSSGIARPITPTPTRAPDACAAIVVDRRARTVRLPPGVGFDPGGIGKGLAADLVSFDLGAAGAVGGCVNVGGDLRVWGRGPHGPRWRIGVGGGTFELTDAGVATSGVERRSWVVDGEPVHHLIDPATGTPASTGTVGVSVVAGSAWLAETCATALVVAKPDDVAAEAERWGVEVLSA
ncbi:MAG: FAD:protein FMN transferase [Actinomycetota bacterium]